MKVVPMTLREANDFVEQFHRHSNRTARDGGKFAIGASSGDELLGVAIVGRPIARLLQDSFTAEVLRVCVKPHLPIPIPPKTEVGLRQWEDAVSASFHRPNNVCSFLYGRCWRVWQAMGGRRMVTYTLASESGASLRGAGWKLIGETKPGKWDRNKRARDWQPIYGQLKFRWEMEAA
jgi:hypothetical protein